MGLDTITTNSCIIFIGAHGSLSQTHAEYEKIVNNEHYITVEYLVNLPGSPKFYQSSCINQLQL